ncbi:anaerobic sulfatase maturase [Vibrio cortegadensis]|uniref:anaerobic sulfatase maturase n=1 Tax=Vibrio cortegadensis TaxID=1328770 RepID=UPI00352C189C
MTKSNINFHVMAKPVSYRCNLKCDYCFYLEKEEYYSGDGDVMSVDMLEAYVKEYLTSHPGPVVDFAWQGGEPTLAGLEYFENAVRFQKKYANSKEVTNSFQTNGVALNKKWAEFFHRENFLIGISIDGERSIHDKYRISTNGRPTFDKVKDAIKLMEQYDVQFNTLTVINDANWNRGKETYRQLKELGSNNMQFIPIVELEAHSCNTLHKFSPTNNAETTPYSLPELGYAQFIIDVFDEWKNSDVGHIHVQTFEMLLGQKLGIKSTLCVFSETCGKNVIIEANGDVYSCDHFVYPAYNVGNINSKPLNKIVSDKKQVKFGRAKKDTLTSVCSSCSFKSQCYGGCPKHRVLNIKGEKNKHNYLCKSYQKIFSETDTYFKDAANKIHKYLSESKG